jgi:poly(A) polymerase
MHPQRDSVLLRAIHDDPWLQLVSEEAGRLRTRVYLVGGWIRDCLLGVVSRDYDFIVEEDPAPLAGALAAKLPGSSFVMGRGESTTHRIVGAGITLDLVRQDPAGLHAELLRRDFTINTIACELAGSEVLDPLGGLSDVKRQVLRSAAPGAFDADPLRMLRAVRFCTTLNGFRLSEETLAQIQGGPERLQESAAERVRDEMDQVMVSGHAGIGLSLLAVTGILPVLFPQLQRLAGLEQGPYHHLDALAHSRAVVAEVDALEALCGHFDFRFRLDPEDRRVLAYGALFHDIGKADSVTREGDGTPHFYGHEKRGTAAAAAILAHYVFPTRRSERIRRLIRYHTLGLGFLKFGYTERALRRIIRRLEDDLPLHVLLSLADRRAARGTEYDETLRRTLRLGQALLDTYRKEGELILEPPPLVTGADVMAVIGIDPGPAVGEVLRQMRNLQIDQIIRTRADALAYLRKRKG